MKKKLKYFFWILVLGLILFGGYLWSKTPSHDRNWHIEHKKMPSVERTGDIITIKNIRNFSYTKDLTPITHYYERTVDLKDIESVDFVMAYFSNYMGAAHTFLTFQFKDQPSLAISIEARREINEPYSAIKGLFRKYEELYVVGDERDLIGIRTHVRKNKVYLFPSTATPKEAQSLFLSMIDQITHLEQTPEFYNTLTNQCTNKIAQHIENISGKKIPFSHKLLLPGYADEFAFDLGFIGDGKESLENLRKKSLINPQNVDVNDPLFSQKIRKMKTQSETKK